MPTEVVMPQMGESIAEGTIVRWIKKVGDAVDRDEPLFEISTDKVDAEIPSPGAGVLLEIKVKEGETVPVNSVVAVIGEAGDRATPQADGDRTTIAEAAAVGTTGMTGTMGTGATTNTRTPEPIVPVQPVVPVVPTDSREARLRTRSSPVVRNIAKQHGVDISQLPGTGISGRVTKQDILAFVDKGPPTPVARSARGSGGQPGPSDRVEKMSVMRKKIAEHMVLSVQTSPHVFSVFEVDFHRVDHLRREHKAAYEGAGLRLTYTAFVAKAVIDAIAEFPFVNASIDGDNIVYKRDVNLGVAVALDAGLIVPVVKDAASRDLKDLSRTIQDLAHRARSKHLKPEEVQGGTFTITNPGVFGAMFGLPIINQPQVAILGVGAIEKRVTVVDDMIAVRPMCYLSLGHDHRLIDGADAGRFLQSVKDRLERFDESLL
jgi:pyruvate dehydrogenase E2 component (dihydrolipoamide acetyltransferase)